MVDKGRWHGEKKSVFLEHTEEVEVFFFVLLSVVVAAGGGGGGGSENGKGMNIVYIWATL